MIQKQLDLMPQRRCTHGLTAMIVFVLGLVLVSCQAPQTPISLSPIPTISITLTSVASATPTPRLTATHLPTATTSASPSATSVPTSTPTATPLAGVQPIIAFVGESRDGYLEL